MGHWAETFLRQEKIEQTTTLSQKHAWILNTDTDTTKKMSTVTATEYANVKRDLRETEELLHVAEQENSALRARVAALEAALAAKDAALTGQEAPAAAEKDDASSASYSCWDCCSCATPEMCMGDCCTSEDYKVWWQEEKDKGAVHEKPIRDFKTANRSAWGLERRLKRAEEDLRIMQKAYEEVLAEDDKDKPWWERHRAHYEDEVKRAEATIKWYTKELEKARAAP